MNPTPWIRLPTRRRPGGLLLVALVIAFVFVSVSTAFAFDAELIISNDNMRHEESMSEKEIQAFLETQPGVLKDLVAKDYQGVKRPASAIIYRASRAWDISPKVMLTMLQKEQSLLTRTTLAKNTLSRAIGAGCPDANTNRYPGFGNQMWHGARLLDSYGEGHSIFPTYYVGMGKKIYRHSTYGTKLYPKNLATFKLYVYNPSVPGNTNFYKIYKRYFGSPFANPRMLRVYRFRHRSTGSYLYTTSFAERTKLRGQPRRWDYDGPKFSVDTSVPVSSTTPLYRFRNKNTGKYSFTISKAKYDAYRSASGQRTWAYGGVAFRVSTEATSTSHPVYRFKNRRNGAILMFTSKTTAARLRASSKWRDLGVGFYLPRYTPPASLPTSPTPTP